MNKKCDCGKLLNKGRILIISNNSFDEYCHIKCSALSQNIKNDKNYKVNNYYYKYAGLLTEDLDFEDGYDEDAQVGKAIEKSLKDSKSVDLNKQCIICYDKKISIAFMPCGHYISCPECSEKIYECPICHVVIETKNKIFSA
jgi:hypothetical protein